MVLATSTVNLFLLISVFIIGITMSGSLVASRRRLRWRWQAVGGAVAAVIVAVALVTGAAQDDGFRATNAFGAPIRTNRAAPRPSSDRPPNR